MGVLTESLITQNKQNGGLERTTVTALPYHFISSQQVNYLLVNDLMNEIHFFQDRCLIKHMMRTIQQLF